MEVVIRSIAIGLKYVLVSRMSPHEEGHRIYPCPTHLVDALHFGIAQQIVSNSDQLNTNVHHSHQVGQHCVTLLAVTAPPAEPSAELEAFRLLAPQRGLTATEHQARHAHRCESIRPNDQVQSAGREAYDTGWPTTTRKGASETILPDLSNFYCLPGRAGDLSTD